MMTHSPRNSKKAGPLWPGLFPFDRSLPDAFPDDQIVRDLKNTTNAVGVDVQRVTVALAVNVSLERDASAVDDYANIRVRRPKIPSKPALAKGVQRCSPNIVVKRRRRQA